MRAFLYFRLNVCHEKTGLSAPESPYDIILNHMQQRFDIPVGRAGFITFPPGITINPEQYPVAVADALPESGYPGGNPRGRIVIKRSTFKQLHVSIPYPKLNTNLIAKLFRNTPFAKVVKQLFNPSDFKFRKCQALPLS